ncbi:hypothetical protein LTR86_010463 [Recurvomyces mirabilis]|nr:hypothetical protein LTR86_010463 [Recurvomyces mirabilis]
MLFLTTAILFLVATSSALVGNDNQQQIFHERQSTFLTVTTTRHVTSQITVYNEPASTTSTSAPIVQTWYGGQKETGCDKTAYASCRYWYKCEATEVACITCDSAPYCAACLETTWSGAPTLPSATSAPAMSPIYDDAAEIDEHDAFRAKVALSALAFFPDRESLEAAVGGDAASQLCSMGEGNAQISCYSKGDM